LRLAAYLIDQFLLLVVAYIIGAIGLALSESDAISLLFITLLLVPWFYEAGMTASKMRGTFGKRIVGLQVLSDTGEQLTFGPASWRYGLKIISIILTLGLVTVPAGIRQDGKAGYDILLKMNVYRK
jgi:uncharacterized RDD family membrane protein YckC